MNSRSSIFVATILEDFDVRRLFAYLAIICLALFLGFFSRFSSTVAENKTSSFGRIVAVLNRQVSSQVFSVPLRYGSLILLGVVIGWALTARHAASQIAKVIAMQRHNFLHSRYTNALPTVVLVVVNHAKTNYSIKAELEMTDNYGTGIRTFEIGRVASIEEAIRNWAFIEWREDGLHIGRETNQFVVERKELESGGR